MKKDIIKAGIVAAVVATAGLLALPANAAEPTGWQERKYAQNVLKEVWRYELDSYDRAVICHGWRTGLGWVVQEPIVEVLMDEGISYRDAAYVTERFFDSACF